MTMDRHTDRMEPAASRRRRLAGLSLACLPLVVLSLGGCGGSSAPPPPGPSVVADYYVHASTGLDMNTGGFGDPFKTITKALSVALAGERIHVMPGTYDTANGETFPLLLPPQVELIGDEPNKGAGSTPTLIRGGGVAPGSIPVVGTATLFLDQDSVLAGFVVIDPLTMGTGYLVGLAIWKSDVTVRNCHVLDCETAGIWYPNVTTGGALVGNVVARTAQTGIHFGYGPGGGRVEGNVVTENGTGMWCQYGEPDLGGGMAGSAGANHVVVNTSRDLMVSANRTISAQGNHWDHAPPTVETSMQVTNGIDVYEIDMTVTVDSTGAILNTDTYTIPLFP